jgi:hypothetical protein
MTSDSSKETPNWPEYRSGPHDHLHAIGAITLNYNLFERALFSVFSHPFIKAGLTFKENQFLIGTMNIKERLDTIRFMFDEREKDPAVREHAEHLITYFNRCAEKRNVIAHAFPPKQDDQQEILDLMKSPKDDWTKINTYRLALTDLRKIADEARIGFRYAVGLALYLMMRDGLIPPTLPVVLPTKPLLPDSLSIHPPPATPASD